MIPNIYRVNRPQRAIFRSQEKTNKRDPKVAENTTIVLMAQMKLNVDLLIIPYKCTVTALGLANPHQSPTPT
jgi:hypothetical protein